MHLACMLLHRPPAVTLGQRCIALRLVSIHAPRVHVATQVLANYTCIYMFTLVLWYRIFTQTSKFTLQRHYVNLPVSYQYIMVNDRFIP